MKKLFALFACLTMLCCCAAAEETAPERTVAAYEYAVTEESAYVENLIFNADVIISGDASQIIFSNCEFNGNIILTSELGTKVMLFGCDVNGVCIAAPKEVAGELSCPDKIAYGTSGYGAFHAEPGSVRHDTFTVPYTVQ